jgi:hypothetical protein
MRYINEIVEDGCNYDVVCVESDYIFTVLDNETHEVARYTLTELKQQKDYKEILGVGNSYDVSYNGIFKGIYFAWSTSQVMFRELIEYIGSIDYDIPELTRFLGGGNVGNLTPVEQVVLDGLYNKCTYVDNCDLIYSSYESIHFQFTLSTTKQVGWNIKDYEAYTDYCIDDTVVCRVQKNCIYQNLYTNTVYISSDGNIYVRYDNKIKHFRIKDLKNYKVNITKIMLLNKEEFL